MWFLVFVLPVLEGVPRVPAGNDGAAGLLAPAIPGQTLEPWTHTG